jgi:hypothetical protein
LLAAWAEATAMEPGLAGPAHDGLIAVSRAMPGYLARWPEERRDEARLRIGLLLAQLECFFSRWAGLPTLAVPAGTAAEVLTDIWYPVLRNPDR